MTPNEINALSPTAYKVYENRLRRMAARQGLRLTRNRARDPRAVQYGRYRLVDVATSGVIDGSNFGIKLDDVEQILTG